jgi:hypothetical protein
VSVITQHRSPNARYSTYVPVRVVAAGVVVAQSIAPGDAIVPGGHEYGAADGGQLDSLVVERLLRIW